MERQGYAQATAIVLFSATAYEVVCTLFLPPRLGMTVLATRILSAVFASLWVSEAIFLSLRKRDRVFTSLSWISGFFALFALAMHALLLFLLGVPIQALTFVSYAILGGFLFKRSFDRGLLGHGRDIDPSRV